MVRRVVDFDRAEALVRSLAAALGSRHTHGLDHPRTAATIRRVMDLVDGYFKGEGASERRFSLAVRQGRLTHEGIAVDGRGAPGRLVEELEGRGCGEIGILPEADLRSIADLLEWLGREDSTPEERIPGVEFRRADGARTDDDLPPYLAAYRLPLRVYRNTAEVLGRVIADAESGRRPDFEEIHEMSRWAAETAFRIGSSLIGPVQLLRCDPHLSSHSVNVFLVATTVLQPIARDAGELTCWARAALLHDIGKCRIPKEILTKKRALTEWEFAVMQRHAELGAVLLMEHGEVDPVAIEVAYCHHMRDEGLGYPIPALPLEPGPVSHVVQVADMFEALVSRGARKAARPVRDVVRVIQETPGMKRRESAIRLLARRLGEAPPGAEVTLASGERGVVIMVHEGAPLEPEVVVTTGPDGGPVDEPFVVDLGADREGREIVSVDMSPEIVLDWRPQSQTETGPRVRTRGTTQAGTSCSDG